MPSIGNGVSDGRAFTMYVSSGITNASLAKKLGARSETEFRALLQANPDLGKPKVYLPPKPVAPTDPMSFGWAR